MKLLISLFVFLNTAYVSAAQVSQSHIVKSHVEGPNVSEGKKTRLLYFWASWCPECRSKLKGPLSDLMKKNADSDLVIVNLDRNYEKGKEFLAEEKLSYTVIRDDEKILRKTFDIYAVPGWVVLKKNGATWDRVGSEAGSDLEKIQNLLTQNNLGAK